MCSQSAINKVSKVKLILSRGQERAQREGDRSEDPKRRAAFWKPEKGWMCTTGRGSRKARGSVKRLFEKRQVTDGDWI